MDNAEFSFDFDEVIKGIEKMGKDITKIEKKTTLKACKVVKEAVEKNIGRSDIDEEWYKHMEDDVKISTMDKDGERNVQGGKKTGWKWTVRQFGDSKRSSDKFVSKSYEETKDKVKEIINNEIKKELGL